MTREGQMSDDGELLLLDKWAAARACARGGGDVRIEFVDAGTPGAPAYATLTR